MATYATLTVPVLDIIGANFNERRAFVTITPNTRNGLILADGIRVGGRREQVINGVAAFTNLVTTNSADNPASFGYRVTITAQPKGSSDRDDIIELTTADFPLTADANLKTISAAWDDIAIPPNWRSDFLDQAEGILADVESTKADVEAAKAAVEARVVEDLGTTDGQTKALFLASGSQTRAAADALYPPRSAQALLPPSLARASVTAVGSDPIFVEYFGGYMWGMNPTNGFIYRSSNEGATWTLYCNSFNGPEKTILRIVPTADGEVLVLCSHGLFKSSNWAGGNAATWSASKVTSTGAGGIFDGFSLDGDGQKFILGEYGFPQVNWGDSRYAYISTDAGTTWVQKWDSNVHSPLSAPGDSHIHAVGYDKFADRFYVSEGHGAGGGVYCSTNGGTTWARAEGMKPPATSLNNGPTLIVATRYGLVMGSDNSPENGLWGVERKANPADEVMIQTYNMVTAAAGLITFAQRGFYDEETDQVLVSFRAEAATTPLIIAAGTPFNGGEVYRHTLPSVGGTDRIVALAKIGTNRLVARIYTGGAEGLLRGTLTRPGGKDRSLADTGNIQGGRTADITGTAAGPGARANGGASVAIGRAADAVQTGGTAVGDNARALNVGSVAVGRNSTAGSNGVALGDGTTTTNPNECAIGGRFFDMDKLTSLPGQQLTNHLQLFQGENPKNSKGILLAKFGTGARRVLAQQDGFRQVTATETLDRHDSIVVINVGVTTTVTLPSAAAQGAGMKMTLKSIGATNPTIACSGAETIDGAATKVLSQWQVVTLMSHAAGWYVIG